MIKSKQATYQKSWIFKSVLFFEVKQHNKVQLRPQYKFWENFISNSRSYLCFICFLVHTSIPTILPFIPSSVSAIFHIPTFLWNHPQHYHQQSHPLPQPFSIALRVDTTVRTICPNATLSPISEPFTLTTSILGRRNSSKDSPGLKLCNASSFILALTPPFIVLGQLPRCIFPCHCGSRFSVSMVSFKGKKSL